MPVPSYIFIPRSALPTDLRLDIRTALQSFPRSELKTIFVSVLRTVWRDLARPNRRPFLQHYVLRNILHCAIRKAVRCVIGQNNRRGLQEVERVHCAFSHTLRHVLLMDFYEAVNIVMC
jgi:hypothetical protein